MKIIGYTCCVNYSDLLRLTYHYNMRIFAQCVVVTSRYDLGTIGFCYDNGIPCIESLRYCQGGATFNRSAMLNQAVEYVREHFVGPEYQYCCFDADTIIMKIDRHNMDFGNGFYTNAISGQSRNWAIPLEQTNEYLTCYGAPREIVRYADCVNGIRFEDLPKIGKPFQYPYEQYGFVGHFQLYNKQDAMFDETFKNVNDSDTAFTRKNFKYVRTISDIICYHLGETGKNWDGRVTEDWSKIKCVD